tara:strand:+ start:751 stop:978 length:228 start_codon:yes stop_codon:yes gene_type:complete
MDGDQLNAMSQALRGNEHFKNFVEHIHERREDAIRAMQTEKSISSTNRHFMEAGKLEALDELLDDLELWWRAKLD